MNTETSVRIILVVDLFLAIAMLGLLLPTQSHQDAAQPKSSNVVAPDNLRVSQRLRIGAQQLQPTVNPQGE